MESLPRADSRGGAGRQDGTFEGRGHRSSGPDEVGPEVCGLIDWKEVWCAEVLVGAASVTNGLMNGLSGTQTVDGRFETFETAFGGQAFQTVCKPECPGGGQASIERLLS